MIKAVIFDMFETLITHYHSPLYFGAQMAADAGIAVDKFQALWRPTENDRTLGNVTVDEVVEMILRKNDCYSEEMVRKIVGKRIATKEDCFRHLHPEIIPMLSALKEQGILVGLISNCFSEEAYVIRNSQLFPYFDAIYLSYEQRIQKPDEEIFRRCLEELSVEPEECLYVGDGGSFELETARKLGMHALQAVWYLKDGTAQPTKRKPEFEQLESPFHMLEKIIDGPDGPTVVFTVGDGFEGFEMTEEFSEENLEEKETFVLKPLEGLEWKENFIPFGCSKKEVQKIFGEPEVVKKSFYYFDNELRFDFDKKGKLEFIEFLGGIEGNLNPIIYEIPAFETDAAEVEELLRQKNGGETENREKEYSCSFWEISVGVYRDITPSDVLEMMEEMKADGISTEDNEDLEADRVRANHWATIGIGVKGYYHK